MKYIEELLPGDVIEYQTEIYLLTSDFKNNGSKLGYSLNKGSPKWFDPSEVVVESVLFKLDENNNVIPLKNIPNTSSDLSSLSNMAHQTRTT